jgi:hypothetical protein
MYPGTTAIWDYTQNKYVCSCAQGYKWNQDIKMCVLLNDNCSATYPNSYLVFNAQGQWQCVCIPGYQWNGTACVQGGNRDDVVVNPQQQKQGNCNTEYRSGANEPEQYTIDVNRTTGSVIFTYNTETIKDRIHVYYANAKVFDTGCVGAAGNQTFQLNGYTGVFRIIVDPLCDPNESNTSWSFTLGCPQ